MSKKTYYTIKKENLDWNVESSKEKVKFIINIKSTKDKVH
jgi:hypothetical protein